MKIITLSILSLLVFTQASAQNLSKQRIWKITSDKRSIYFDQGIFHSENNSTASVLTNIRNSYVSARGFERVVFDFAGIQPPKVYGHISMEKNKLYIDFFNTTLNRDFSKIKNVKYVENIDFFNIDKDLLSIELSVSQKVSYDIFYLTNPARVVVDIKK